LFSRLVIFFVFRVSDEKLIEEFHSRMLCLLANFGRNEWQDYFWVSTQTHHDSY